MSIGSNVQQIAGFELGFDKLTTKMPFYVPYELTTINSEMRCYIIIIFTQIMMYSGIEIMEDITISFLLNFQLT